MSEEFFYSRSFHIGKHLYRSVSSNGLPIVGRKILSEQEWRRLGIQMSKGWNMIGYYDPIIDRYQGRTIIFKKDEKEAHPNYIDKNADYHSIIDNSEARFKNLQCLFKDFPVNADDIKRHPDLNLKMMTILQDWMLAVSNKMGFKNSVFSHASYLLWRFFRSSANFNRRELQLVGTTCLMISSKIERETAPLDDYVFVTDKSCSPQDLVRMEKMILEYVNFSLLFPTLRRVIDNLLEKVRINDRQKSNLIDYLANLATIFNLFPRYSVFLLSEVIISIVEPNRVTVSDVEKFKECQEELLKIFEDKDNKYGKASRDQYMRAEEGRLPGQIQLISESSLESNCCRSLGKELGCEDRKQIKTNNAYIEKEALGKGTFGQVSLVTSRNQTFAKKSNKDPDRMHEGIFSGNIIEATIMYTLEHPNLVKIFDPRIQNETVDFYMPLLKPFNKIINGKPLTPSQVSRYAKQLLEGVKYFDERDIIHRDLKPENVLFDEKNDLLKIADFGAAIVTSTDAFRKYDTFSFTLWYRPPEVIRNLEFNKNADVWSLGCIFAQMATGIPLFPGQDETEQLFMIFGGGKIDSIVSEEDREQLLDVNPIYTTQFFEEKCRIKSPEWKKEDWDLFLDLLTKMVAPNPRYRWYASECLRHPFFVRNNRLEMIVEEKETLEQRMNEIRRNLKKSNIDFDVKKITEDQNGAAYGVSKLVDLLSEEKSKEKYTLIIKQLFYFFEIALPLLNNKCFNDEYARIVRELGL